MAQQARWGRTAPVTLPSGARVQAKRVSITTLLYSGAFPSELTGLVWKMFNESIEPKNLASDQDALKKMIGIIEQVVPHVLVDPVVDEALTDLTVDEQGFLHGKVKLGDIDDLDKQALMLFGQGLIFADDERAERGAKKTGPQSFRDESARTDAGPSSEAVQPATVESGGAAA